MKRKKKLEVFQQPYDLM